VIRDQRLRPDPETRRFDLVVVDVVGIYTGVVGLLMYFNHILTIFCNSQNQKLPIVYAAMIRLCAYDCSVNFYSSSYVVYCVRYIQRLRFVSCLINQ